MTPDAKPADDVPIDVSEDDVDAALATCGGDARATIRTLLVATRYLERDADAARAEASWGYIRARPSRKVRHAS